MLDGIHLHNIVIFFNRRLSVIMLKATKEQLVSKIFRCRDFERAIVTFAPDKNLKKKIVAQLNIFWPNWKNLGQSLVSCAVSI